MCDWKRGDFKSLSRTLHPSSTRHWSGHHWPGDESLNQMPPFSRSLLPSFKIITVNTTKCVEPKIRQSHHNFTGAVRHLGPASNLERYREAEEAEGPTPTHLHLLKTKQVHNIKYAPVCTHRCVYVYVRGIHRLEKVIVL